MAAPMSAQDRVDVIALIARYAQCLDGGDVDGYVANFLPAGVIEWATGRAEGRDATREWVGGLFAIAVDFVLDGLAEVFQT